MSSDLIIALRLYLYIDALSCSIKLKFVPNLSIFLKVCISHIRDTYIHLKIKGVIRYPWINISNTSQNKDLYFGLTH